MEALRVCAKNKLPPEVIVMHFGITSNPHHDTAGIQHYFKHNLYPWLKKYTNSIGAHHIVRSDGCSGQMKSGRHFRWVSNFHTEDWNLDHIFLWTHSESAHGKDRVDSECGRMKYILRCHEMRDTFEAPTQLKSSREQFELLDKQYSVTRRTHAEKKGTRLSRSWAVVCNGWLRYWLRFVIDCTMHGWLPYMLECIILNALYWLHYIDCATWLIAA